MSLKVAQSRCVFSFGNFWKRLGNFLFQHLVTLITKLRVFYLRMDFWSSWRQLRFFVYSHHHHQCDQ